MRVPSRARAGRVRRSQTRFTAVGGALVLLVIAATVSPSGAPAGQSSQAGSAPVAQVVAGLYHSCALVQPATLPLPESMPVRCWGFSGNGQVGHGNTGVVGDDEVPAAAGVVDVGAGRTVKALAAGEFHTCAVLDDGSVRCWGYGNEGQLGYGNRNHVGDDELPAAVGPVSLGAGRTATAITAGGNHTCAVLDDGNVRCWGLGEFGQLGYGGTNSIGDSEDPGLAGPVDLLGHTAKAVTAGLSHTCAILDDDSVRCWGVGGNGQLGYGATAAVLDPSEIAEPADLGTGRTARAITAGAAHTCAILDDGSVRCWGLNHTGQLGYGNTVSIGDNEAAGAGGPVDLGPGRTATAISAGGDHTCAVLDSGALRCWGSGLFGQLGLAGLDSIGDDETPASVEPVDLGAGRLASAVVAGIFHTCARLDGGSVRCWGNGADGRLGHCSRADIGDDETPGSVEPVDIGFGGAACPVVPPPPPPPPPPPGASIVAPPPPLPVPVAAPDRNAAALRAERARAQGLRSCRAAALRRQRSERTAATRRYRRGSPARSRALRSVARRAARARARCLSRFARIPGRVTTLSARAATGRRIILSFRAAGSDGSRAPAARSYLVKQSLRPIRIARDFERAATLCRGACRFAVTQVRAALTLQITQLRRNRTYYYAIAARDNVSRRTGPRSRTVRARAR